MTMNPWWLWAVSTESPASVCTLHTHTCAHNLQPLGVSFYMREHVLEPLHSRTPRYLDNPLLFTHQQLRQCSLKGGLLTISPPHHHMLDGAAESTIQIINTADNVSYGCCTDFTYQRWMLSRLEVGKKVAVCEVQSANKIQHVQPQTTQPQLFRLCASLKTSPDQRTCNILEGAEEHFC